MFPLEASYPTAGPEYSNVAESQEKHLKITYIIEFHNEGINKSFVEIQEITRKQFEEMNKYLKENTNQ